MRICFDLDDTLCTGKPYKDAVPIEGREELLKSLKGKGHTIIIYTARGMGTSNGNIGKSMARIGKITLNQLEEWNFVFDEIVFGKPSADLYVDDKGLNALRINELYRI